MIAVASGVCAFLLSMLGFSACRNHSDPQPCMYGGPPMYEEEHLQRVDTLIKSQAGKAPAPTNETKAGE